MLPKNIHNNPGGKQAAVGGFCKRLGWAIQEETAGDAHEKAQ